MNLWWPLLMPIDARCPFCTKIYRLKDDLVGKKVTCANQDCRKVFAVAALDAETVAAAALSDEVHTAAVSDTVPMQCVVCEHKWAVPREMTNKNVLCPECKHRQKVPEQKGKAPHNWREGGGGPSLAKRETLDNVTSARDTAMVSGETLVKTGVIDDGVEPVPLKVKLLRLAGVLGVLLALGLSVYFFWIKPRQNQKIATAVAGFIEDADGDEFKNLPLHRAILHTAAGEYMARQNDPKALEKAVDLFGSACTDLAAAPKGYERDFLISELGIAMLSLGGEGEALKDKKKLPWMPTGESGTRAQIRNNRIEQEGVVGQIRRPLELLQSNGTDFDFRAWNARRLARVLIGQNQLAVLESNLGAGFTESETHEIRGQIGLELFRAGKIEESKAVAESLLSILGSAPAPTPNPVSVYALWLVHDLRGPNMPGDPSGVVLDPVRQTHVAKFLAKKESAAALEVASKPGLPDSRLKALALCTELADDPAPFFEAAEKAITDAKAMMKTDPNQVPSSLALARLAFAAAKAGDDSRVSKFTAEITDQGFLAFVNGEVLRLTLARDRKAGADDSRAPLPAATDNGKDFAAGIAYGRYWLARHNGALEGNALGRKLKDNWPKPLVAPFGVAGAMLGAQDAS